MLVLKRGKSESVQVGNAMVTVLAIRGGKVVLGIDAPQEVPVHRTEVLERGREPSAA